MNMEPLGLLSIPTNRSSRMLKKYSSFVLVSLSGSTYRTEYASPPRSLRPCWKGLFEHPANRSDSMPSIPKPESLQVL